MKHNSIEILLVEDNLNDAELTIRALRKHKLAYNLVHVINGAEALDFVFATGKFEGTRIVGSLPKLVLMDVNMPKMNGIEALKAIRADDRTSTIPVVILTSSKEDSDVKACYKNGANSYVVKPVNYESFNQTIGDIGSYWLQLNQQPVK